MYRRYLKGICWVLLLLALLPVTAAARQEVTLSFDPQDRILLLLSPQTGQVLYAQNENKQVPIASVTKIMTLILAFEAVEGGQVRLDDPVKVSETAAATEGSQAFLDAGSTYPLSDLLKTVIIASANDSCVAVAEFLAGSEPAFVLKMNEKAAQLGMEHTCFCTCTGLPYEGQFSTAADVAKMAQELLTHDLYFTWSTTWMDTLTHPSGRQTELTNTNRLVRFYEGADGVKTGYSSEAGHCLAATAVRGGMRLLAVVLGYPDSKSRFNHAQQLLNAGFDQYELVTVAQAGQPVGKTVSVRGGSGTEVQLVAGEDLYALKPKGAPGDYQVTENLTGPLSAPVRAGDCAGTLTVLFSDGTVKSVPLLAPQDVTLDFWGHVTRIVQGWCG